MPHRRGARRLSVFVALAGIGILTGCGGGSGAVNSGASPAQGGELVIARSEEGRTLDPAQAVSPAEIAPINQIFDRLFTVSADGHSVEPSLAESATPSADGTKWTIVVRKVTFSDGTPLTAEDVKYSLDRSRTSDGGFSFLLAPIESVDVVDAHTVVIKTTHPSATLLPALSSWVASVVPANLGGKTDRQFFADPVGSGPYVFASWDRGQSIRLTRNTSYWQTGKPLLDAVEWRTVPDDNTRVSQVQSGQADVADNIPFSQVAALDAAANLDAKSFPANYTTFLIFNEKFAPFADVHVRRAIAHAVDRKAVTESTLFGAGSPACSMVPPSMPYASEPDCLQYDVEAAKAELSQSSWPNGFDVELTIDTLPISASVAQILQAELSQIGISVKIKVVDSGQLYTTYGQQAYQLGFAAWASDIPDPDEQLSYMLDPDAGGNSYYTGYSNSEVTRLINEGRQTLDSERRAEIYAQVQQIAAQDVPQLPISNQGNPYVWSQKVQGFWVNPMGTIDLLNAGIAP